MSQPSTIQQMKLQKLRTMQRDLKKANASVRAILRVKALIAVYKGMAPEIVAECYEVTDPELGLCSWGRNEAEREDADQHQAVAVRTDEAECRAHPPARAAWRPDGR